jgi:hypothetical protein
MDIVALFEARSATKYLAKNLVVTVTRRVFGGKLRKGDTRLEFVVKAGRPNYRERQFIKTCIRVGAPFPIEKIQIRRFKER